MRYLPIVNNHVRWHAQRAVHTSMHTRKADFCAVILGNTDSVGGFLGACGCLHAIWVFTPNLLAPITLSTSMQEEIERLRTPKWTDRREFQDDD